MEKSDKNFIKSLLIIIVVGVLCALGYYIYNKSNQSDNNQQKKQITTIASNWWFLSNTIVRKLEQLSHAEGEDKDAAIISGVIGATGFLFIPKRYIISGISGAMVAPIISSIAKKEGEPSQASWFGKENSKQQHMLVGLLAGAGTGSFLRGFFRLVSRGRVKL